MGADTDNTLSRTNPDGNVCALTMLALLARLAISVRPSINEREQNVRGGAILYVIAEIYAIGITMTRDIANHAQFLLKKSTAFTFY